MAKKKTIEVKSVNRSNELVHEPPSMLIKLGNRTILSQGGSVDIDVSLLTENTIVDDNINISYTGGFPLLPASLTANVADPQTLMMEMLQGTVMSGAILNLGWFVFVSSEYTFYSPLESPTPNAAIPVKFTNGTYQIGVVIQCDSDKYNVTVNGETANYIELDDGVWGYDCAFRSSTYPTEYDLVIEDKTAI